MRPSGAAHRADREAFFNTEILDLIPHAPTDTILAGDFNRIISSVDCTGHCNRSRALERLIQGLGLVDVWEATADRQVFTHHTSTVAALLDRICHRRVAATKTRGRNHSICLYRPSCGDAASGHDNPDHT